MKRLSALVLPLLLSCTSSTSNAERERDYEPVPPIADGIEFSAERVEAHMRFLADDLLEGREAATRGHELAALYVASRFEAWGVEPAGTDGYMQPVGLQESRVDHESSSLTVVGDSIEMVRDEDYFFFASHDAERIRAEGDLVYAGYGVTAPEMGWDDYSDIDAEGKLVVLYRGAPPSFPSTERAIHASTAGKYRNASEHGAIGVIWIRSPDSYEDDSWERTLRWKDRGSTTWADDDGNTGASSTGLVNMIVSDEGTRKLFSRAPFTWEATAEAIEEGEPLSGDLGLRFAIELESEHSRTSSPNVIGMVPGSDLDSEAVLLLAHLDHVGVNERAEEGEDAIYNGAYDNASGVATLLEVARAFSMAPDPPRRSVLFAAVTAEEKGLIGAEFLANNPVPASEDVVAAISFDMFLMLYPMNDVVGFGAEHSTIGDTLERVAASMGVAVGPDYAPELNLFVRTDHYPFVKSGIPGLFLVHGPDASPEEDGKAIMDEWLSERYHDVDDDMSQPIDFEVGERLAEFNYVLTRELANQDERPVWYPDSMFADIE